MTFDDVIRVGPSIAAIRNGGASVLGGRAYRSGQRTLVIPLRSGLAEGDYSVRWSIVSDDGHLESGVVAFAVGAGRAPPSAGLSAAGSGPSADAVGTRWLFFSGLLCAVGIALFTLVVRPRELERIPSILATAGVVAALGAVAEVHRVGLSTRDGRALIAGFVLALVVATLGAAATLDLRALRPGVLLALPLAVVPALAGHALDRGVPRFDVAVDVAHVAAAAAWVGVLVGLVAVRGADVRRAGLLALGSVAVLGATGIVRAVAELTRVSQLWDTGYGRTLLVKTGLLAGTLGLGWLLRSRPSRRASAELVVVAGLVVAVAVLVELRPGRNAVAALPPVVQVSQPSPNPPTPPAGAIVLAREAGRLGIAVAVEPKGVTAIVLSPAGGGLSGLDVTIDGTTADPCGSGCYHADVVPSRTLTVRAAGFGTPQVVRFTVPSNAPAAAELVRDASLLYHGLTSVTYVERLASDPQHGLVANWRLESPNKLQYSIRGGGGGIVVGARRWDRSKPGSKWVESPQTPLPQPGSQWTTVTNAHVIAQTASSTTVSFADPTIPAYFTVVLDRHTLLTREMRMTAPAHFMVDRYTGFNVPRVIRPPR